MNSTPLADVQLFLKRSTQHLSDECQEEEEEDMAPKRIDKYLLLREGVYRSKTQASLKDILQQLEEEKNSLLLTQIEMKGKFVQLVDVAQTPEGAQRLGRMGMLDLEDRHKRLQSLQCSIDRLKGLLAPPPPSGTRRSARIQMRFM